MSPYKNFVKSAKEFFESNGFLKFLLSAHIYVFALGGLLFLLGSFIAGIYDPFTSIGSIIIWAGLLLTLISGDVLTLIIASGSLAVGSLIAWIVGLVVSPWGGLYGGLLNELYDWTGANSYIGIGGFFRWQPFFYFLIFAAIAIIVMIKSEKLKQMRAEAAARSAIACPRCGGGIPRAAVFCPNCGAPNPAAQYAQQPYAPPAGQYAPPFAPAAPAEPAMPAPPPFAPAAPVEPAIPAPPPFVPSQPAAPAVKHCVNCGAELPAGAVFCGKCGTKQ